MEKREKKIVFIICLGHFLCHAYILIYTGALSSIEETFKDYIFILFGKQISLISIIGTISYLLFGIGSLPAGLFATKTNAKLTLKMFYIFSAVSSLLLGISIYFRNINAFGIPFYVILFAAGLPLLGLSASLYHISGLTLISHGIKVKGRVHGIHGVFGSLGIASAPFIAGLITSKFDWRVIYLIMTIPGLIGFLFLFFDRDIPESHVDLHNEKKGNSTFTITFFIIFLVAMGINGFIYRGFLTIFPTYIKNNFTGVINMDPRFIGGIITFAILIFGTIGQYAGGHLSDKIKMLFLYLIIIICSIPFMFFIGASKGVYLIITSILFTLFHFAIQPVENHMISVYSPPKIVSSIYGMKFIITFGVGSLANTTVIAIKDNASINYGFYFLGILIVVSSVIIIFLNIMYKKKITV